MLEYNKSYALVSKCPQLQAVVTSYLIELNRQHDIFVGDSLYEKSIKLSDTATPNSRQIVISQVPRDSDTFTALDIDSNLVELVFEMNGMKLDDCKDYIRAIKQKTKRLDPLLRYYKLLAILGTQPLSLDSINDALELNYTGVHTTSEQVGLLVEFINNPTEINLQRLVRVFNESGYQKLINCITMLVNEPPEWVANKYKEILESAKFIKALLKVTLITLKAETRDEFILYTLKEIIYK